MQEVVGVALLKPAQVLKIRSPGAALIVASRKFLVGEEGYCRSSAAFVIGGSREGHRCWQGWSRFVVVGWCST